MPRTGRLHIPGGCYHVMGRGLERRRIFNQADDKNDFLERLGNILAQTDVQCLAWAIMSNHYHLLMRVGAQPLSKLMSPLLGGYASSYNRRHRRRGYVFQNRYKSILFDADSYLLELVRTIHLNPIKAKILKSLSQLDRYHWTGHAGLLGIHSQSWQAIEPVLGLFGKRIATARQRYREFMAKGIKTKISPELSGGGLIRSYGGWEAIQALRQDHIVRVGDERILGDSDFVEQALKADALQLKEKTAIQRAGWDIKTLIQRVCAYCEIAPNQLKQKGRSNNLSLAKALICYWGTEHIGATTNELADRLGMSQPAASQSSKRGREYCREQSIEMEGIC